MKNIQDYLSTNKVLALAMLVVIISKKKEGKIVVVVRTSRKIKGNNACCEFRRSSKDNAWGIPIHRR